MSDQELKELVARLAVSHVKLEEYLRKSSEKFDEELRKSREESERRRKEFDEELKKSREKFDEELKKSREEFEKSSKEFDKRMEKLEKKLNKIGLLVGGIGNNQGDVAEEYFVNSLKNTLKIANINFDYLLKNVGLNTRDIRDEFDILLVNKESVALIEVKYKVHPAILEDIPEKIEHLKLLPQYKGYKIYAGIAGFYIPDEVIKEATKRGYFVLQRKGDVIVSYTDNLKAA